MQKMRVSPMRIVKKDGKVEAVVPPIPQRTAQQKETLRDRLRQIEKRWQREREEKSLERRAMRSPAIRAVRLSRARGGTRTNAPHSSNRAKQKQPTPAARWRRDVALQAAVCAVMLVSALGFRAIDTLVTNRITDGLAQAVTMEIDLSENLGELQFVRSVMPESVLVFWSKTADAPSEFYAPMNGEIAVHYTEKLPGILIVGEEQPVFCAADGEVVSISQGDDGDYILRIRHDGGMETIYGFLQGVKVAAGERVRVGQEVALGMPTSGGSQLYFQSLKEGEPFDPVPLFRK